MCFTLVFSRRSHRVRQSKVAMGWNVTDKSVPQTTSLLVNCSLPLCQIRWTAAGKTFQEQINRLVGDVLLATGFLSYSGPFNQDFRNLLQDAWKKEMSLHKIPFTEVGSLNIWFCCWELYYASALNFELVTSFWQRILSTNKKHLSNRMFMELIR